MNDEHDGEDTLYIYARRHPLVFMKVSFSKLSYRHLLKDTN